MNAWLEAMVERMRLAGAAPAATTDGATVCEIDCAIEGVGAFTALLPETFERVREERRPLRDGYGNDVDDELTLAVFASETERAIFHYFDHWQAGLSASISVYSCAAAYEAALTRALAEHDEAVEGSAV